MQTTYITFGLYLILMMGTGFYFMKRSSRSFEGYLLGERSIGSWVTAMSAEASDMSGWLLMGLPGAIYLLNSKSGLGDIWCAVGLAIGTLANWLFVAPRLRVYSGQLKSLTIAAFFTDRFKEPYGLIRIFSSAVILFFFAIYAGSGLVAAGRLFETMFNMDYRLAVIIGTAVILLYTFLGGYLAVCWTDLVQGLLMFFALIIVPAAVIVANPNVNFMEELGKRGISCFPDGVTFAAVAGIISAAVWGLGYFGQPHILTRFMSIKSHKAIPRATCIAMSWLVISLIAVTVIGLIAIPIWSSENALSPKDSEKIFIFMIQRYFSPWLAGIMLAAILAAIMSTIDSQLLVCSSAIAEDFYKRVLRKNAAEKELVLVSRIAVMAITVFALILAFADVKTIFSLVKFAWGGFGAAFGPVMIFALYSKKTSWQGALAGMIAGTAVMLVWYFLGLNKYMYEILPGFAANIITIPVFSALFPNRDNRIDAEFSAMKEEINRKD